MDFIMLDDEKLVTIIQSHPLLYDRTHKYYRNIAQKRDAWNKIGAEMEATAHQCSRRWTSIRERFSREKRRMKWGGTSESQWYLMDTLSFLESHYTHRRDGPPTHSSRSPSPSQYMLEYESESRSSPLPLRTSPGLTPLPSQSQPEKKTSAVLSPPPTAPSAATASRTNGLKRLLENENRDALANAWGKMEGILQKSLQQHQKLQHEQMKQIQQLQEEKLQHKKHLQEQMQPRDKFVMSIAGIFAELQPEYRAAAVTGMLGIVHGLLKEQASGFSPEPFFA